MELKLYKNGEIKYFLNTETGVVRKEDDFPCSSPGREFLKPVHTESEVGTISQDDVQYVLNSIKEAKEKGYNPHPGYDGWANDLYPFWNSSFTAISPGKKR